MTPSEIDSDGEIRFAIPGPALDAESLSEFSAWANRFTAACVPSGRMIVDLSAVVYADALGLEALLDFVRRFEGECKLIGVRPGLADWLARTHLANLLSWTPNGYGE